MSANEKISISFQEGSAEKYIEALMDKLGGEVSNNTLIIDKGPTKLKLSYLNIEGVEFSFCELESNKAIVIERLPDGDPELLHLNIIKDGNFDKRANQELTHMHSGSLRGVFLYNGLFPIQAEFPPHTLVRFVSFKFKPSEMGSIYDDLAELYKKLFVGEDEIAYHANLSKETYNLISDIFSFQNLNYGKNALISAKAIEIFTNRALHFKKEVEENDTLGLHISDYNLLMKLKEKIEANIETSFTIDELSREFGVSSTKLKNDFKHLFGTTIHRFYNQARMNEAYRRLKSGEYTVSEIGYDLGYSNLSKFSQMFKKMKGILPTEVLSVK